MKNLFIKLLACILVLTMMLTFAACSDSDDKNTGADTDTDTDTDTDDDDDKNDEGDKDFWGDDDIVGDDDDDDTTVCVECVDADGDLKCDVCGTDVEPAEPLYDGVVWLTGRGKGFFSIPYDGTKEFDFKSDGQGKTWQWIVTAQDAATFEDVVYEEGVVEATFTPNGNIGILFGGVGLEIPNDGATNVANSVGLKYYYAEFKAPGMVGLYMDELDEGGTFTTIQEVAIADIDANYDAAADVTIKVEFTLDGKITLYVNGNEAFSVEGYRPFGTQIGMMVDGGSGFEVSSVVGTVKSFAYGDKVGAEDAAPEA